MEEQRLADSRLYGLRQERLGDQIGGFWPFPSQQLFRIGGDEDHRNVEGRQDLADRVNAAAAFAQIDIRQHQAGTLGFGLGHGVVLGGGDGYDPVAELRDQVFQIQRNDRFVLDNQDLAGKLAVYGFLSFQDGAFHILGALVHDERR